ncbi:MAG TPA: hypothetical protein VKV80_14410 [Streptosporangiaceae bacterium]|nr:hypothetical protein [Streptosporangiaceae bacterium]
MGATAMGRTGTWQDPHEVIALLAAELEHGHGLHRLYINADDKVALLSACTGVTVWYIPGQSGQVLAWAEGGEQVTWPAADPQGAAARIAARCRTLTRPAAPGRS